ncbi:MAG: zinc metallopeptidase [Actinomycetota bacterium]|nr:zinc metallopeptidase [Actinomycetota bacterium]
MLMVLAMVLGIGTQAWVNGAFRRWSRVELETGRTGGEIARAMLDEAGLSHVTIEQVPGNLTDHFDPRAGVLRLSKGVYGARTVAAAGVASHEAGHAVQHAHGNVFARIRMSIAPVAQFGSQASGVLILLGFVIGLTGLVWLGIVAFAGAVLFQIVTLPVEFDASRRAIASLDAIGAVPDSQVAGARQVLTAAAMTYLAATLVSILYLLYYIGLARD